MRCPLAFALAVLFGVALAVCSVAQQKEAIKIELEPDARPEAVDVRYFLTGPFGGFGSFIDGKNPEAGRQFSG
jgi:hypothetical protein